jgi:hypothetical protein
MEKDLEARTKRFALAAIKFVAALPRTRDADILGRQLTPPRESRKVKWMKVKMYEVC